MAARRRLGRSLAIREVDAGSCNACELEIYALNNAYYDLEYYDLERFGLRFVATPRHADVLLVTGPVSKNMREALDAPGLRRGTPRGGCGRGLRRRLQAFRRQLRLRGRRCLGYPRRLHNSRLPATPAGLAQGSDRADRGLGVPRLRAEAHARRKRGRRRARQPR
jgi:NADH ubiquinone oxidoreductase subunit